MTIIHKTHFHIGSSLVHLEKLCKKIVKFQKKCGLDSVFLSLIQSDIETQKDLWEEEPEHLTSDINDCNTCQFFNRIHKRLIVELLEGGNELYGQLAKKRTAQS